MTRSHTGMLCFSSTSSRASIQPICLYFVHEDEPYNILTRYFPQAVSSAEESEEESVSSLQPKRKTSVSKTGTGATRKMSDAGTKKPARSPSSDSSASSDSSVHSSSAVRNTGAPFTTEEVKQKILSRSDNSTTRTPPTTTYRESPTQKQSRYSTPTKTTPTTVTNDDETETSTEEETDSEEEIEEEQKTDMAKTDIGPLLARSANARDNGSESTRKPSRDETYSRSRYTPKKEEEETPRYGGYTSRFLNKSRSSANIQPDDEETHTSSRYGTPKEDENKYSSGKFIIQCNLIEK